MKPIVIVGAGISGLVAAWALEELDIPFRIVDKGPRESLPRLVRGCVYFHDRCNLPESEVRSQEIRTGLLGVPGGNELPAILYHEKVWGDKPYVHNSVERLPLSGHVISTAWSMNDALRFLTHRYLPMIEFMELDRQEILDWSTTFKVVSTIPLYLLAPDARCEASPLWIFQGEAGYWRGKEDPDHLDDPTFGQVGHVIYNVDPETAWYRLSCMFGYISIEYSSKAPGMPLTKNMKIVTSPDADAFEQANPSIMLTGRWGRWARGVLGHETYHAVREIVTTGRWS